MSNFERDKLMHLYRTLRALTYHRNAVNSKNALFPFTYLEKKSQ